MTLQPKGFATTNKKLLLFVWKTKKVDTPTQTKFLLYVTYFPEFFFFFWSNVTFQTCTTSGIHCLKASGHAEGDQRAFRFLKPICSIWAPLGWSVRQYGGREMERKQRISNWLNSISHLGNGLSDKSRVWIQTGQIYTSSCGQTLKNIRQEWKHQVLALSRSGGERKSKWEVTLFKRRVRFGVFYRRLSFGS